MKKLLLPVALTMLLAFTFAPALNAQEKKQHKEPETELGKAMKNVGHAWRSIRKQVADPTANASTLELVATVKANLEKGLTLSPIRAQDEPAADREKFIADFHSHLKDFLAQVDKLAAALKANDNATAQDLVKQLGKEQRENHKAFRRPEE